MIFEDTKLRAGRRLFPAKIAYDDKRIYLKFRFNRTLINEIKMMDGARWHGFDKERPAKMWSVPKSQRNQFQLDYLFGNNPYAKYDKPLIQVECQRPLYSHQYLMVSHCLTRHYAIIAGEMGVGKSLAAIVTMEKSNLGDWWWVGPKSALKSVELELLKWESGIRPRLLTYDALRSEVAAWVDGKPAPQGIILDESARVKNRTAQRSQAAAHVVNSIRDEFGDDGYAILMSGTPSPKAPTDWWNQCEIACPGFLIEGNEMKFRNRLALIESRDGMFGGQYPHLITWWDDENKCKVCGQYKDNELHTDLVDPDYHPFQPSVNEVANLSKRLEGLVLVLLKKDCLDLPEKQYRVIECKPQPNTLRAAEAIANSASSTIKALTLLRELSDGFQYSKKKIGTETCVLCKGMKFIEVPDPELYADGETSEDVKMVKDMCPNCDGTGEQNKYERTTTDVKCPKDDALIDLLDEHSDLGRIVIYAGFTGSIDKICGLLLEQGWAIIRMDRQVYYEYEDGRKNSIDEPLMAMDNSHPKAKELANTYPKLAFVGHPASGSEGLTLTASPSIVYYSNDFNGMYRMQSEARIHRAGMDNNRGATIIDLYHLPTDKYVHDNLKKKKKLQSLSLVGVKELLK